MLNEQFIKLLYCGEDVTNLSKHLHRPNTGVGSETATLGSHAGQPGTHSGKYVLNYRDVDVDQTAKIEHAFVDATSCPVPLVVKNAREIAQTRGNNFSCLC